MAFLWVGVDDEAGPSSLRRYIKGNAIALLSNCNCQDALIDASSSEWLGNWAASKQIRLCGLWNVNHVAEGYDPRFLDVLGRQVPQLSFQGGLVHSEEAIMNEPQIRKLLVDKGMRLFRAPKALVEFTGMHAADELLNDLEGTPHAFVLGCVMDRQVKAELAWLIPYRFSEKLGSFDFSMLSGLGPGRIEELMTEPEPLHRFPSVMSECFYRGVELIAEKYGGNTALIWDGEPSSAAVVYRFLEFKGIGPKIATMAANILAREFKIPFSDYYSIDVSADVHVRRVFARLGLVPARATNEQIIYCARALHPDFPGLLDFPVWEIGRTWCRPKRPDCAACYMNGVCPSASQGVGVSHSEKAW